MRLILGIIFSSIGVAYVFYARRNQDAVFYVCGALLLFYSYLFSNLLIIFLIGAVLTAIPIARAKGLF